MKKIFRLNSFIKDIYVKISHYLKIEFLSEKILGIEELFNFTLKTL